MGLLTEIVKMNNNGRTRLYYKDKAINITNEELWVKVEDLTKGSSVNVDVQCDYCGKIFQQHYVDYIKLGKTTHKVACHQCTGLKIKESFLKLYGVDNISQSQQIKDKKVNTCEKNFGCMFPMQSEQVIRKSKETMVEKYGVEHNFHRQEIVEKVKYANAHHRFENGTINSSKAQI